MKRRSLRLITLDDVAFSLTPASVGGHESCDFIPGAAVLGFVAGRLYRELPAESSWLLFHSGKMRFGNGRRLSASGVPTWPAPLCWHYDKNADWLECPSEDGRDGTINESVVFNGRKALLSSEPGRSRPVQPTQLRGGWVAVDGSYRLPKLVSRMKTSIDPETGRAREAALFGYEAIAAGQHFVATLEADDDIDDRLFMKVVEALDGKTLRLGRSRRTEYGRATCQVFGETSSPAATSCGRPSTECVDLWLLSDATIEDGWGRPCLAPTPADLGISGGKLDSGESFIRTRRYAPYNGYLRRHEPDRVVLQQGSVLRFRFDDTAAADSARAMLMEGIGLYREGGLGTVWVDPPLISGPHPEFRSQAEPAPRVATESVLGPTDERAEPMVEFLVERRQGWEIRSRSEDVSQRWSVEFQSLYNATEVMARPSDTVGFGPGATQWGRVQRSAAVPKRTLEELKTVLFDGEHGTGPVCSGRGWEDAAPLGDKRPSFADLLRACLDERDRDGGEAAVIAVGHLAGALRAWLQERGR